MVQLGQDLPQFLLQLPLAGLGLPCGWIRALFMLMQLFQQQIPTISKFYSGVLLQSRRQGLIAAAGKKRMKHIGQCEQAQERYQHQ